MSASGHKQTFAVQNSMSALPPKADMCGATRDVRFVPIADIAEFTRYIIGDGDQPWRHLDAEHSRRLTVDDELEFGRLQHRQSAGFAPLRILPV